MQYYPLFLADCKNRISFLTPENFWKLLHFLSNVLLPIKCRYRNGISINLLVTKLIANLEITIYHIKLQSFTCLRSQIVTTNQFKNDLIIKSIYQMNEETFVPDEIVMNKILHIRNQKVMLDSDLAELYGVGTKVLNQSVSRSPKRFPLDFMFQLTAKEWVILRSKFVTTNWSKRRSLPYVFTEHGVLMLSSVLNSSRAIEINIQVMRIFTRLRQMFIDNTELHLEIEKIKSKLDNQDKNMEIVFRYLDELIEKKIDPRQRKRIGFKSDDL